MNAEFRYKGYTFIDNDKFKSVHGPDFNLFYNKETGYTERWGATRRDEDDPALCELGPTIMDIELCKDIRPEEEPKYANEPKSERQTCKGRVQVLLQVQLVHEIHPLPLAGQVQAPADAAGEHPREDRRQACVLRRRGHGAGARG